jgi:aspartyl-tRNA(Asn)/glutamyl-tRNA(Gln) amidotransferase subunit B
VKRAIEIESARLIGMISKGEKIVQQTRSFDANNGTSFPTRDKEEADDYRYFPEPDLSPFHLQDEYIAAIMESIPMLQPERVKTYKGDYQLSEYDATVLTEDRAFADYFESITGFTKNYKAAANWMLGPVKSWLNESGSEIEHFPLGAGKLAELIDLVDAGKISFTIASARVFPELVKHPSRSAADIAVENNLLQDSDVSSIESIIDEVIASMEKKVDEYRKGKKGLLSLFVGEVMKRSKGKADPRITNELLLKKLKL